MPFLTYRQARPWAKAIRAAVLSKKMPPWFADPRYGHFANDASLAPEQIRTIAAWAEQGSPPGLAVDAPVPRQWLAGWNIGRPDRVFRMPTAFQVPEDQSEIEYQYIVVPTGFTEDHWVQQVEVRPGNRAAVHHAVIYLREPGSEWLSSAPRGSAFTVPDRLADGTLNPMSGTTSDILFTYTPGNSRDEWPRGMGKLIKAGSDLVFQMHYTALTRSAKHCCTDQTAIALVFSRTPPIERVLTLQMGNSRFVIPPGHPDYRVHVSGTLPNDGKLLSLYPHMHLRGTSFEYSIVGPAGAQPLLKVNNYDFYWQLTYRLADPLLLKAGTRLEFTGVFDNSRNNANNPDPASAVRFGTQSTDEMMIGFFDMAVPAGVDKQSFFVRAQR